MQGGGRKVSSRAKERTRAGERAGRTVDGFLVRGNGGIEIRRARVEEGAFRAVHDYKARREEGREEVKVSSRACGKDSLSFGSQDRRGAIKVETYTSRGRPSCRDS